MVLNTKRLAAYSALAAIPSTAVVAIADIQFGAGPGYVPSNSNFTIGSGAFEFEIQMYRVSYSTLDQVGGGFEGSGSTEVYWQSWSYRWWGEDRLANGNNGSQSIRFGGRVPVGDEISNFAGISPIMLHADGTHSLYRLMGSSATTVHSSGTTSAGIFDRNDHGYVSFRLNTAAGGILYGWLEIEYKGTFVPLLSINSWAFQDDGTAINAGQIPAPATPALALIALASGAAGIRRKRSA